VFESLIIISVRLLIAAAGIRLEPVLIPAASQPQLCRLVSGKPSRHPDEPVRARVPPQPA